MEFGSKLRNSITDSSVARLLKRLPGFEMMFKADGHTLEGKLQDYLFSKGLPFRVTVVTGPSGSYREVHILNFLDKHLDKVTPCKTWEFLFLDAHEPFTKPH